MTPAELSFHDVFRDGEPTDSWGSLNDKQPLFRLRTNFWGKDICDEKRKWQERQTTGHPMDTDEAPANFAFETGVAAINVATIWVREDYVVLYDECNARFANARASESEDFEDKDFEDKDIDGYPPSIVITGQPGIGK